MKRLRYLESIKKKNVVEELFICKRDPYTSGWQEPSTQGFLESVPWRDGFIRTGSRTGSLGNHAG